MGGDLAAWGLVLGALAATGGAFAAGRRRRFLTGALLLALAAVLLRANLAHRHWLDAWDERYHAVVARNLTDHPLRPTLVERPFDPAPPEDWSATEVWLHKPPMALWWMAGSLAVFGENEPAVRVPSVLLSGLGVLLTFLVGRRLLGAPVGLLGAGLHAWHGHLSQLAGGLRATDHVDALFGVFVALVVWLGLCAAAAFRRDPRAGRGWLLAAACGLALGVALLTKSSPAWVGLASFAVALWVAPLPWHVRLGAPALAAVLALAVRLPWQRYTSAAFPEAHAYSMGRNARYFWQAVDAKAGPPWFYVSEMADQLGPLAPVAVALFVAHGLRRRELWPLLAWLGATYGVFSLAATKMPAYVSIAAPAVLLAMAWVCHEAWRPKRGADARAGRTRLARHALAVAVLVGFVAASAWRVHRPWRAPERRTVWAEELRYLGERLEALAGGPFVVFGVPNVPEARFYTRATPVERRPTPADLGRARELGMRVAIYGAPDAELPEGAGLVFVPHDPRTGSRRAIVRALPTPPLGAEVWLWNARDPDRLETYLERFVPVDVRARVPSARDFARARAARGPVAILLPPGAPDPKLAPGAPWVRVESAEHARPVP